MLSCLAAVAGNLKNIFLSFSVTVFQIAKLLQFFRHGGTQSLLNVFIYRLAYVNNVTYCTESLCLFSGHRKQLFSKITKESSRKSCKKLCQEVCQERFWPYRTRLKWNMVLYSSALLGPLLMLGVPALYSDIQLPLVPDGFPVSMKMSWHLLIWTPSTQSLWM